jgi:hypothetical protein
VKDFIRVEISARTNPGARGREVEKRIDIETRRHVSDRVFRALMVTQISPARIEKFSPEAMSLRKFCNESGIFVEKSYPAGVPL